MTNLATNFTVSKYETQNSINTFSHELIVKTLGSILGDFCQLFIKTQDVHKSISGPYFYSLHKLTQEQYKNINIAIDSIAERIRSVNGKDPISYAKYGAIATIYPYRTPASAYETILMLVKDHETVCGSLCNAIKIVEENGDRVSAALLTQRLAWHKEARLAWHEEAMWILRAASRCKDRNV